MDTFLHCWMKNLKESYEPANEVWTDWGQWYDILNNGGSVYFAVYYMLWF